MTGTNHAHAIADVKLVVLAIIGKVHNEFLGDGWAVVLLELLRDQLLDEGRLA